MKKLVIVCLFALAAQGIHAQSLDSTLSRYAERYLQEKVYLHYDKSSYYAGETVWFKAYLLAGLYPSDESKTLYVDWVGDNGTVLWHSVSPLVDAATNGQFEIPSDYNGSFIHVRAYTKWMLNFDTAFIYSKDLRLLTKTAASNKPVARPAIVASLQFFPEGGDAVTGVSNRVAFKATDQWGRPVRIRGVVQDGKGQLVDSLRTIHDGMGSFMYVPQENNSYTAKWKDEKGGDHTTALPAARNSGVSMQVTQNATQRIISLYGNSQLSDALQQLHLVGTTNQREAFRSDINLKPGGNARRIIPALGLPSGILTLTLFDANWNALAERITFIDNHDFSFSPTMDVQHWGLSKRKRNEIRITLPDSLQGASLSISVTDAAIEKDTSDNIISHFFLTSEIRGEVYQPSYYFSGADSAAQHLDLVMLTNGWRRFKWEDVARGKFPTITYPHDSAYLTLSGKVFGVAKSQLSGKESIVLVVREKDSTTKMMVMPINTNGTFSDPGIILFDTVSVYYSLKSKFFSQAEARFMTERLPAPNYAAFSKRFTGRNPFYDTTGSFHHALMAAEEARLLALQKGRVMETVTIKTKQKTPVEVMDEKYSSGLFKGGDGYQYDLVNDRTSIAYPNAFSYLQGKVAGLQISGTGAGTPTLTWRGGAPSLYLDEMQTDADMISGIPVADIAYIKVFRPPFMGGFGGANGAIAIYTRRGEDAQNTPGKGLSANKIEGYTPIKQFYSPNYERFDSRNEQPDIRTTLLWNPMVLTTPKNHQVVLTFFNNDITQSFRVVIEGMTKDGLLTHFEQIME
jgi:hypothetical protein